MFIPRSASAWETYEGGLRLSCTCDRLGHVSVLVDLHDLSSPDGDGWHVQGVVPVEAGQLEGLAAEFDLFMAA